MTEEDTPEITEFELQFKDIKAFKFKTDPTFLARQLGRFMSEDKVAKFSALAAPLQFNKENFMQLGKDIGSIDNYKKFICGQVGAVKGLLNMGPDRQANLEASRKRLDDYLEPYSENPGINRSFKEVVEYYTTPMKEELG